jgi:hypothetical protein
MRLIFGTALLVIAGACGTDAVGVETCKKIEHARCDWAMQCAMDDPSSGIDLNRPVRRSKSTSPVDDCYRFYDDACLHGLPAPDPNDAGAVQACVDAINTGDCTIVIHPETADACAFLIPPADSGVDTGVDAGTD